MVESLLKDTEFWIWFLKLNLALSYLQETYLRNDTEYSKIKLKSLIEKIKFADKF